MSWRQSHHATGCVRLAKALRETRALRQLTQAELAARAQSWMDASTQWDWHKRPIARAQVAQWEGAHRRIAASQLEAIEQALEVRFDGVDRRCTSPHHMGAFCRSDLGAGPLTVTCGSTGNTLVQIDGR